MRWQHWVLKSIMQLSLWLGWVSCQFGQEVVQKEEAYQRVFVPQSDLSRLVPNGFVPIKIAELEQLLGRESHSRLDSMQLQAPYVGQIRLVANLVGEDLLSEASCFAIRYMDDVRGQINLRPLSLALKPSLMASTSERNVSLFSSLVYTNDGIAKLTVDESVDLWFGWSLHAFRTKPGKWLDFRMELPPCLDSRLLLRLPPAWRLDAEGNVAYHIEEPLAYLRSDWPTPVGEGWRSTDNWWLLELGGASRAEFRISRAEETQPQRFPLVVRRQRIDQEISSQGTSVVSQWTSDWLPETASAWNIELAEPLRVQRMTCNGVDVEWEQQGRQLVVRPPTLELAAPTPETSTRTPEMPNEMAAIQQWELIATSLQSIYTDASPNSNANLWTPLRITNAYVLAGESSVRVTEPLQVERMDIDIPAPLHVVSEANKEASRTWRTEWTEGPPHWQIRTSVLREAIPAELLVQFIPQAESILANVTVRCDVTGSARATLPMRVAEGWILEGVNPLESDLSLQIAPTNADSTFPLEIQANPIVYNRPLFFELQLRRFNPASNREQLQIAAGHIIEFQDLESQATYMIENGSGFSLRPDAEALEHRVRENQLADWQKRRLPRFAEPWLFQSIAEPMPELLFERQSVNFLMENETHVTRAGESIEIQYILRCTPVSGSVQRLAVLASERLQHPIAWSIRSSSKTQRAVPVLDIADTSNDVANGVDAPMEIRLNTATLEPFELQGFLRLPVAGTSKLPILATMEAFQERSFLWITSSLHPELKGRRASQLAARRRQSNALASDLGFAFEASPNNTLAVSPSEASNERRFTKAHVTAESIIDFVAPNGAWRHFVVWEIEDWSAPISCQLPEHWQLERLYLDGHAQWGSERQLNDGTLSILPPSPSQMSHQLVLECVDQGHPLQLWSNSKMDWPAFDAVLGDSSRFALVPAKWSFRFDERTLNKDAAKIWPLLSFGSSETESSWVPDEKVLPAIPYFQNASPMTYRGYRMYELPNRQHATPQAESQTRDWPTRSASVQIAPVRTDIERAWGWILLVLGSGMGAWLSRRSLATILFGLGVGIVVGAILQLLISSWSVTWIGVWCAGCIMGASLSFALRSLARTMPTKRAQPTDSRLGMMTRTTVLAMLMSLGTSVAIAGSIPAQPPQAIMIPIDRQGQVDGTTAYISPEFYQRLLSPSIQRNAQSFEIISAAHQVTLNANLQRSALDALVTYELLITNSDTWIRLPYSTKSDNTQPIAGPPIRLKRFLVNDLEVVQGARLRMERGELLWKPERTGRTRVRISTELQVVPSDDGTSATQLPVLAVPTATLEVLANAEVQDLRIQANGQVLNPAAGKHMAQLGPLPQIALQWKSAQPRLPRSELRTESTTLLDLRHEQPQAWTRLTLGQFTPNGESLEIEAPSDWQPLGVNWRDAVLQSVINSSTLAKRRYRLSWNRKANGVGEERTPNRIEVYWVPESRNGNLLSVPLVEVVGARAAKQQIGLIHSAKGIWRLDGVASWPSGQDRIDAIDPSPFGVTTVQQAYEVPESTPPALLRRSTKSESSAARGECLVHFEKEKALVTLDMNFGSGSAGVPLEKHSSFRVEIPETAIAKRVWIDGQLVDFVTTAEPKSTITIYPLANQQAWQGVRIQCELPVHANVKNPWPLFQVPVELIDLRLRCTRSPNVSVTLQGTEGWIALPSSSENPLKDRPVASIDIGQWNVPRRWFFEQAASPTSYWSIDEEQTATGQVLTELSRVDNRWHIRILGRLQAKQTLPTTLLLETSRATAEMLNGPSILRREPLPASNRGLLHLMPQVAENGEWHFDLEGMLTRNASDPFEFPEMRWLGAESLEQFVCLPVTHQAQALQWEVLGAELVEEKEVARFLTLDERLSGQQFYRKNVARLQVQLNPAPQTDLAARSLFSWHSIRLLDAQSLQVDSHFWLEANNQPRCELRVPADWTLLRTSVHGRPFMFDPAASSISIPLFPNHGPVLIHTTMMRSGLKLERDEVLELPELQAIEGRRAMVVFDQRTASKLGWKANLGNASSVYSSAYCQAQWEAIENACESIRQASTDQPEKLPTRKLDWYQPWRRELTCMLQQTQGIAEQVQATSTNEPSWQSVQETLHRLEREVIGPEQATGVQDNVHHEKSGNHFARLDAGHVWAWDQGSPITLRATQGSRRVAVDIIAECLLGLGLCLTALVAARRIPIDGMTSKSHSSAWVGFAIASLIGLLLFPWLWVSGTLATIAILAVFLPRASRIEP